MKTKTVQKIQNVESMAKSRFFWLPLFTLTMLSLLFSDVFVGFRDLDISTNAENIVINLFFDINFLNILIGTSIIVIFLKMLYGMGRRIGGWLCLIAFFVFSTEHTVPIYFNGLQFMLAGEILFSILFLSWWYILAFYGNVSRVPLMEIVTTYIRITVLMAGFSLLMLYNFYIGEQEISFVDASRDNNFSFIFAGALILILSSVSLLWKNIFKGKLSTSIFEYILFWGVFSTSIGISTGSIWGYFTIDRNYGTLLSLELTLLVACFWILILLKSMYEYRLKQSQNKKDLQFLSKYISDSGVRNIIRIPTWTFILSLIFSNVFLGIRAMSITNETLGFFTSEFDFNILAVASAIISIFNLLNMLKGKERQIGGWVCLTIALLVPVGGTSPIWLNEILFHFPHQRIYIAMFLSYGFILLFYSAVGGVPIGKMLKTSISVMLFFTGITLWNIFNVAADNLGLSFTEMFGYNTLNAHFTLGALLILVSLSLNWKDIISAVDSAKWISDLLQWGMFFSSIVMSLISIWGYFHLLDWMPLSYQSLFTLEWSMFLAGVWGYFLFRAMYKYRVSQLKSKTDLWSFMNLHISEKILGKIVLIPGWLIVLSLPMFFYHFYNTSIWF